MCVCVTTETRPLDRLGQLGEFEQDSNTGSELESNTDSQRAAGRVQAFATLTTTGYGDIVAISYIEKGFSMIAMLVGLTAFSYMITAISRAMDTMNARMIRQSLLKQVRLLSLLSQERWTQ